MCGRFSLTATIEEMAAIYDAKIDAAWTENYNIAPTQIIPVIVERDEGREITPMKWGLIPFWAKDAKIAGSMINARAETLTEKPGFRDSFKDKRCIIPASGFYEWGTFTKQPHYFTPKEGLFAFAGLWSRWISPDNMEVESCSIITIAANDIVKKAHYRMPAILGGKNACGAWLHKATKPSELKELLTTFAEEKMEEITVSKYVNSVKNLGPRCIEAGSI